MSQGARLGKQQEAPRLTDKQRPNEVRPVGSLHHEEARKPRTGKRGRNGTPKRVLHLKSQAQQARERASACHPHKEGAENQGQSV